MSSHGVLSSMLWRDYRELRAFWVATVLLAASLEMVAAVMITRLGLGQYTLLPTLAYALVTPALYALGCAAMMFAGEHESGMYGFLQALPVDPRRLLLGRTVFVLASTLLMLAATCGTFLLFRRLMSFGAGDVPVILGTFAIVPLELFVWGVLFSLVCRRPLAALLLGGTLGTCIPVSLAIGFDLSGRFDSAADWWLPALTVRIVVVGLVAAVDLRLAARWFHDDGVLWHGRRRRPTTSVLPEVSADSDRPSLTTTVTRRSEFGRLLWQQWRQSRRLVAVFGLATLLIALVCAVLPEPRQGEAPQALLVLLLIPLAGACAFREDWQGRRYRFLAHCGARPGRVWLTRQLVWFGVSSIILLVSLSLLLVTCFEVFADSHPFGDDVRSAGPFFRLVRVATFLASLRGGVATDGGVSTILMLVLSTTWMLAAYTLGQFCSIYTRSSIMAGMIGFVLLLVFTLWAVLMSALWVNWLWSVLPVPLVLLVATRLRCRDWMLGRTDWRARARAVLVPVVPLVVLVVAVPFYRVYSVPAGKPDFAAEELPRKPTPEQLATAQIYTRAYRTYTWPFGKDDSHEDKSALWGKLRWKHNSDWDREPLSARSVGWLDANRETIDTTVEASRHSRCFFPDVFSSPYDDKHSLIDSWRLLQLGQLVTASAKNLTTEDELDAALERYLAAIRVANHLYESRATQWGDQLYAWAEWGLLCWAAHPDQTAERIERALKRFTELETAYPSHIPEIVWEWRGNLKRLAEASTREDRPIGHDSMKFIRRKALLWFPWERARARRAIDTIARRALETLRQAESDVHNGRKVELSDDRQQSLELLVESTCLVHLQCYRGTNSWIERTVFHVARNRAFRLQMALAAWRLEHGDVPKSLDELVGTYLDAVPIDPFTGKPFRYFPEGISRSAIEMDKDAHRYPAKGFGPFVWSPGGRVLGADGGENEFQRAERRWSPNSKSRFGFTSRWHMLRTGLIFPVP